jgi:hypothetical protein
MPVLIEEDHESGRKNGRTEIGEAVHRAQAAIPGDDGRMGKLRGEAEPGLPEALQP